MVTATVMAMEITLIAIIKMMRKNHYFKEFLNAANI